MQKTNKARQLIQLFSLILIFSSIHSQPKQIQNNCKGKCIKCQDAGEVYNCLKCIDKTTDVQTKKCGSKIKDLKYTKKDKSSIKISPKYLNCIGVEKVAEQYRCFLCTEGFFLNPKNAMVNSTDPLKSVVIQACKRNSIGITDLIEGCLVGKQIDNDFYCFVCTDGFPSIDNKECIKFSKYPGIEKSLYKYCSHGVKSSRNDKKVICGICKELGYAVQSDYTKEDYGSCVRTEIQFHGCARIKGNNCEWCNFYAGYYMQLPNKCMRLGDENIKQKVYLGEDAIIGNLNQDL